MPKLSPRIVSILLTVAYVLAMRTGHYGLACVAILTNGLMLVLAKPPHRNLLRGGISLAMGLWLLALLLGLLALSVTATTRQTALYVGAALMALGWLLMRTGKRKAALACGALGALLMAYGLGYLG